MNQRDLWSRKATKSNEWLAGQCVMRHKAVVKFDSHGKETNQLIEFGAMPVRLPWRDEELQAEGKDGTGHSYKSLRRPC